MKGHVVKETAKYIYTIELVHYVEKQYFLRSCQGNYCTVYASAEAAKADMAETAKLFHDRTPMMVVEEDYHGIKYVHHRYKK